MSQAIEFKTDFSSELATVITLFENIYIAQKRAGGTATNEPDFDKARAELAELRAAFPETYPSCVEPMQICDPIDCENLDCEFNRNVKLRQAELAELRKDRERLEWLSEYGAVWDAAIPERLQNLTFRAAIDDATANQELTNKI
jgi:hypothetical protein